MTANRDAGDARHPTTNELRDYAARFCDAARCRQQLRLPPAPIRFAWNIALGKICPSSLTSSNRTDTRFDTPDSSIVTPYSVSAPDIVFFECVIDDELREREKLAQHGREAADVGFVERGVDFVEDAERAGLAAKHR